MSKSNFESLRVGRVRQVVVECDVDFFVSGESKTCKLVNLFEHPALRGFERITRFLVSGVVGVRARVFAEEDAVAAESRNAAARLGNVR